jgi:hypothetical protein
VLIRVAHGRSKTYAKLRNHGFVHKGERMVNAEIYMNHKDKDGITDAHTFIDGEHGAVLRMCLDRLKQGWKIISYQVGE